MSYELILRASYENNKEVLYKSPNIDGDFVIRGYTNPNDAPPLHRAGIINDACFNLLSSTNTYPNVSIDTINTSNATLASEDFTISFWCNIQKDSIAQNTVLFSATDGDNYSWSTTKGTFLLLGNPVRLLYDNTTYLTSKNTLKLVDGKNHFICIERKNDTLYVFIDGKLEIEDDITTRFGVAHYPFANVKFSVGNGGAEDSDGTRTLKRSMLVDGYTLIKGICIWDKEFTPPKRDAWDLISNGYLDTTGLAYYHNKIVEYINKNSIVRQNNHLYNKDDIVRFNNMWIKCMIGGTTASTPPTLTTEEIGTTITDGGVTWTVVKYALTTDVPPLASALATPRKIKLTGKAEGSTSFDGSTNASINVTSVNADTASKLTTARTINITGNATGSADFDGTSDVNINVMVNSATKATQDSAGQQINTTYLKGLSISGQTITYTRGNNTTGTITTQDTIYTHPNSGVNAGTYKSVTVNAQGHVTGGSNPTTLSGYGITDAPTKTGDGASGTWGISISGNADTASKLAAPRKIELTGNVTGSADFDGSKNIQITAATPLCVPLAEHITWTVTGTQQGDFDSLQTALNEAKKYRPIAEGALITIKLLSGFELDEPIRVSRCDLRHVEITAEDSKVIANTSKVAALMPTVPNYSPWSVLNYLAFIQFYKAFAPTLRFILRKDNNNGNGYTFCGGIDYNYAQGYIDGGGCENFKIDLYETYGVSTMCSNLSVLDSTFSDCWGGIATTGNSSLHVRNSTFTDFSIRGISLWGGIGVIEGCTITGCRQYGILFAHCEGCLSEYNTESDSADIRRTKISNCGVGGVVFFFGGTAAINRVDITGCRTGVLLEEPGNLVRIGADTNISGNTNDYNIATNTITSHGLILTA